MPSSAYRADDSSTFYKAGIFLLAAIYAAVLASTPMEGIADRANYLEMASVSPVIFLRFFAEGYLAVFTNEPLWLAINSFLNLFFSDEVVVRILIFIPAFVVAYKVLLYKPGSFIFLLLILFAPQVIKNFILHLRQGVAIALFVYAWFCRARYVKLSLIAMTPLIHSSFFFVIVLLVATEFLKRMRFGADLRLMVYTAMGLTLGFAIGGLSQALGARQATNDTMNTDSGASGLAFIYWSIILLLFVLQGKKYIKEYCYAISSILLYLTMYFLTPIAGRVFESSVVFVFLAGLSLTGWRKLGFIAAFCLFTLFMLASMAQQPMFGFAPAVQ